MPPIRLHGLLTPEFRRTTATLAAMFAIISAGCGKTPTATPRKTASPAVVRAEAGPMIEAAEAEAFATELIEKIRANDPVAAAGKIEWSSILSTAWSGLSTSEKVRSDFERGFREQVDRSGNLFAALAERVQGGGRVDLLRIREREGRRTVLIRILLNPGVNYMEFALERQPDGMIRATDIYLFLAAEWFSTTLRRVCLPLAAQVDRSLVDRLLGADQLFVKHLQTLNRLTAAGRKQDWQGLLKEYNTLPVELQHDKNMLLMRYRAATELGDDDMLVETIAVFRQTHRKDPCLSFLSIDYYMLRGQYAKSLEAVAEVDESVGGDPSLQTIRANLLSLSGDEAGAEAAALQVIDDPALASEAYNVLFVNAVRFKNHPDALKWLEALHALTPVLPEEVEAVPENAEFIKSTEYQAWVAKQAQSE